MRDIEARFWHRVEKTRTCWLWGGATNGRGYGVVGSGPERIYVHRLAYQELVGPIPEGLEIDHLCRVRHCVRPDHLEAVTHRENTRRQWEGKRPEACTKGHPYTPENTMLIMRPWRVTPAKYCKTCNREKTRAWKEKQRGAA